MDIGVPFRIPTEVVKPLLEHLCGRIVLGILLAIKGNFEMHRPTTMPRDCRQNTTPVVGEVANAAPEVVACLTVDGRFRPDVVKTKKHSGELHYEYILGKHLLPALGDKRLRDVTHDDVQGLINYEERFRLIFTDCHSHQKRYESCVQSKRPVNTVFRAASQIAHP